MGAKAAVAGVLALGLVAAGAFVADGFARSSAEDQAAELVTRNLQVDGEPDVQIGGFPFLPQMLSRTLEEVSATATGVTFEGVTATDVTVDARDVGLESPYRAGAVDLAATITTESVQQIVKARTGMDVVVDGDVLRATGDVLGMGLTAGLVPHVTDGRLLVDVSEVTLGAATLQLEDLPGAVAEQLVGIEVPLAGMPPSLTLESAQVVPGGVRFTATGTDVVLEPAP